MCIKNRCSRENTVLKKTHPRTHSITPRPDLDDEILDSKLEPDVIMGILGKGVNVQVYSFYCVSFYWALQMLHFLQLNTKPSTSKKITTCFIVVLILLWWSGTEPAIPQRADYCTAIFLEIFFSLPLVPGKNFVTASMTRAQQNWHYVTSKAGP